MALRLEQARKSGVIYSYAYDAYWPGGTKNTACLKNVVGLLTEVASCRVATPVRIEPGELAGRRKGLPEYRAQMNFPNPWPGGWWRLRDIVDYELIASNSLLETCSTRGICAPATEAPSGAGRERGSVRLRDPARSARPGAAARWSRCGRTGSRPGRGRSPPRRAALPGPQRGAARGPAHRPFLVEMMGPALPEVLQGPDTKEIFKPYDVTAWTLPLLMVKLGARGSAVPRRLQDTSRCAGAAAGFGRAALLLPAADNQPYAVANRLRALASRWSAADTSARRSDLTWKPPARGLRGAARGEGAGRLAAERRVGVFGLAQASAGAASPVRARIGLMSWAASMEKAGPAWCSTATSSTRASTTRLQANSCSPFRRHHHPGSGQERDRQGSRRATRPGYFELPPPIPGDRQRRGEPEAFVEEVDANLHVAGRSTRARRFNLPVRNLVGTHGRHHSLPGTGESRSRYCIRCLGSRRVAAYCTSGPASPAPASLAPATRGRGAFRATTAVAAAGQHPHMAGRAAIVEASPARQVVLFGPRIQNRARRSPRSSCSSTPS
jgi:hypothetical protein